MEQWRKSLARSLTTVEELAGRFGIDPGDLRETANVYPFRITPHYLSLIERPGDPIWRQCIPDPRELDDCQESDPLREGELSPVPGLIHRYPDRVVWLVSSDCGVYCRFCMRKRNFVAPLPASPPDCDAVLEYIGSHPEIRDVLLSGGDPLLLSDDILDSLLEKIRRIPHVAIIRIGTRVPATLPERVTPRLARMLKKHPPLYVNTHFNHPREIGEPSSRACARLADAGIPLGNQTVLLRDVNDTPEVMAELVRRLLSIRVRPYYLHQMDLVRGTGHFRTTVEQGLAVMAGLRGHVSGMAIPHYVIDAAGGKGKIPLVPHPPRREGGIYFLTNFRGEIIEYRDPEETA